MKHAIGLDLGGSSAKLAIVSSAGEIRAEDLVPIESGPDAETVLSPVAAAMDRLSMIAEQKALAIQALGCGFSGYLNDTRTAIEQNNTPALNGFALERWLASRFGHPVTVENDACAAAFAETQRAHLAHGGRVLFVTVGSGIGVVLVVDGAIVRVMKGITGDASHLIVNHGSIERCPYGCFGCLETVASARAIARAGAIAARDGSSPYLANMMSECSEITGLEVARAAESGDGVARGILVHAGEWLGVGLASLACVYLPDTILLGGAVSGAGDAWLHSAVTTMRRTGTPFCGPQLKVATATLGNRAGVIGAALMAIQAMDRVPSS